MNNKGFAITGILYTLFVLFLLILVSILSGLSLFKNLMSESAGALENSLSGKKIESSEVNDINSSKIVPYYGKYIFRIDNTDKYCTAYLDKGTNFEQENITFIPKDCNDYDLELTLTEAYNFEDWS